MLLGDRIHVQCVIRNVSEAIQGREVINRMAYYDPLTSLPNKTLCSDEILLLADQALSCAQKQGASSCEITTVGTVEQTAPAQA